jgi:hypothetical protein
MLFRLLPYLLFTPVFWVFRVPYYLFVPIIRIDPDTFQYANLAWQMDMGLWPKFGWLPPIYPVFIYVMGKLGIGLWGMALMQSLIAFLSGLLLVYAVSTVNRICAIALSVMLIFYFGTFNCIAYQDASILTESLYSSSIVAIAALMILALSSQWRGYLSLLSLALTAPILLRPNGLAYVAVFLAFFGAVVVWKRDVRLLYHALPFVAVMLLVSAYNVATMRTPVPFRIGLHVNGGSEASVDSSAQAMMLWYGVSKEDSTFRAFQSLSPAGPLEGTVVYPEAFRGKVWAMLDVKVQSGDLLYRSNLLKGHTQYVAMPPPFQIMTASDWRNFVGVPLPEGLIPYTVREYWAEGIPDFEQVHASYGSKVRLLQHVLVQVSAAFHQLFAWFRSTAVMAFAALVLSVLVLVITVVQRKVDGLRLLVLLLAFMLLCELVVTVFGAGRMLPRYAFPISFMYPLLTVLAGSELYRATGSQQS